MKNTLETSGEQSGNTNKGENYETHCHYFPCSDPGRLWRAGPNLHGRTADRFASSTGTHSDSRYHRANSG
jgi:hypothetical protein